MNLWNFFVDNILGIITGIVSAIAAVLAITVKRERRIAATEAKVVTLEYLISQLQQTVKENRDLMFRELTVHMDSLKVEVARNTKEVQQLSARIDKIIDNKSM